MQKGKNAQSERTTQSTELDYYTHVGVTREEIKIFMINVKDL